MVTIEDQGLSYVQYKADGVSSNFMLIFPYLRQEHILVFQDGVLTTDWTWLNASEIHMTVTPVADTLITLKRQTEQNERLVDFQDGGQLSAKILDLDSNQMFYLSQEAIDTTNFNLAINSSDSTIDAQNNKIINMEEGTDGTDAVNKNQLDAVEAKADAAVVTADAAEATANAIAATANDALAASAAATASADAASVTANAIASTANDALAASADATASADEALSAANAIAATADQAALDAATAVLAANQAVSDAATAQATADQAILDSHNALTAAVDALDSSDGAAYAAYTHALATVAHGATGEVVGTTNIQTLTNKTLSGASIESPVRSDTKQDTKANLDTYALTASNGQLCFGTDTKAMYQVIDNVLRPVGGSSGGSSGGLDTIFQLVGDESITDWTTGGNATFLGAGAISGTFVKNITDPMQGLADYMYTQDVGSLNDYLASPSQLVDPRFRGKTVTLVMNTMYDGGNNDIEVIFYDATNSVVIPSSVFIKASTDVQTLKTNVVIPLTCAQIRIGFQTRMFNYSGKILRFDSIQMSADTTLMVSIANQSQSSLVNQSTTFGVTTITGALSTSVGSGLYSYNSGTGVYTSLRDVTFVVSVSMRANSASIVTPTITRIGFDDLGVTSSTTGGIGTYATTSATFTLPTGGTFSVRNLGVGSTDTQKITVTATASNTNILTAPETFSTDTAPLVYASSAKYNLATLSNAPVNTFITFTYAANTNTRTQTTTAPTQTTADMNANGILIKTRAYNAASTTAFPTAFAIQIGKGLKGLGLSGFNAPGKSGLVDLDFYTSGTTIQRNLRSRTYNETTGVLYLDVGFAELNTVTDNQFFSAALQSNYSSAYITINASKNPALTGLNIGTVVAARGVSSSGKSFPASTVTTVTYDATKTFDTHGALNAATGIFTAPEAGHYQVNCTLCWVGVTGAVGNTFDALLYQNDAPYSTLGRTTVQITTSKLIEVSGADIVYLAKGDILHLAGFQGTTGSTVLSTSSTNNYFSIQKLSIG